MVLYDDSEVIPFNQCNGVKMKPNNAMTKFFFKFGLALLLTGLILFSVINRFSIVHADVSPNEARTQLVNHPYIQSSSVSGQALSNPAIADQFQILAQTNDHGTIMDSWTPIYPAVVIVNRKPAPQPARSATSVENNNDEITHASAQTGAQTLSQADTSSDQSQLIQTTYQVNDGNTQTLAQTSTQILAQADTKSDQIQYTQSAAQDDAAGLNQSTDLSNSQQQLSTGLKINSALDDPAGLAVSDQVNDGNVQVLAQANTQMLSQANTQPQSILQLLDSDQNSAQDNASGLNLSTNLSSSQQQLSTGLKINSALDDPAGLAVANQVNDDNTQTLTQIDTQSLSQADTNVQFVLQLFR